LKIKAGFSFDSTMNVLTINPGSLAYIPNAVYKFTIQTTYFDMMFSQEVSIQIDKSSVVPIANLK
jgi:hypothetical protein